MCCSAPFAVAAAARAAAMATHTVPGNAVQDRINLSSEERALFDTLLAAANFAGSNTVLRAAGGWVRDKLLGLESKDIDIALDNMLGKDFADKVGVLLYCQLTCNDRLHGSAAAKVCMHWYPGCSLTPTQDPTAAHPPCQQAWWGGWRWRRSSSGPGTVSRHPPAGWSLLVVTACMYCLASGTCQVVYSLLSTVWRLHGKALTAS
eukprot:GHRQ01026192.1.p1 GENE.GHRQ01026192.1~~GHRQ01026192.1.p1  ORF type:complete len:205 (-),score=69.62 GHRQ01026192.1:176-790(-)